MPESKADLLRELAAARAAFDEALAAAGEARLTEAGAMGEWSAKDVVAHVTWAVRETVGMLEAQAAVGSPLWRKSQEERNQAVYRQNRERPLEHVLTESRNAHAALVEHIEEAAEHDLLQADWYAALGEGWTPARVIRANATDHYRHHSEDLRRWLDSA